MRHDPLDDLLVVLVRLRRRGGAALYRRAVAAARVAVAREVLAEAERKTGTRRPPATVVPFPLGKRFYPDPMKDPRERG